MNQETRYSYEKKIKELQEEIRRLSPYRETCLSIFDGCKDVVDGKGSALNVVWVMERLRWLFK